MSSELKSLLRTMEAGFAVNQRKLLKLVANCLRPSVAATIACPLPGNTLSTRSRTQDFFLNLGTHAIEVRDQVLRAAAVAMRQVLLEQSQLINDEQSPRSCPVALGDAVWLQSMTQVPALHSALEQFAKEQLLGAEFISLRLFAGLTMFEATQILRVSQVLAENYWRLGGVHLRARLPGGAYGKW